MAVTFLTNEDKTQIQEAAAAGKLLYEAQTLTDSQKRISVRHPMAMAGARNRLLFCPRVTQTTP